MSYPSGTIKVSMSGTLPEGEIFSVGFQLQAAEAPTPEVCTDAANIVAKWLGNGDLGDLNAALWSADTVMTAIDTYGYDGGATSSGQGHANVNFPGSSGYQKVPNQIALVIGLRSGFPGRSNRGRMYWPATAPSLANGQLDGPSLTKCVNAVGKLFEDIAADTSGVTKYTPAIASKAKGHSSAVVELLGNSRLDTQRRRMQSATILFTHASLIGT